MRLAMPNLMPGMPVRKGSMFSMQLSKSAMAVNRPMTLTFLSWMISFSERCRQFFICSGLYFND